MKFNTNGNDLNWEEMLFLQNYVEDIELAIFNGDIELDEEGRMRDYDYEGYMDSNPTIVYYKAEKDLDLQELLRNKEKIDEYVEWYIVHDTNGNHVTIVGDVPDEYLTEEYAQERREFLEALD